MGNKHYEEDWENLLVEISVTTVDKDGDRFFALRQKPDMMAKENAKFVFDSNVQDYPEQEWNILYYYGDGTTVVKQKHVADSCTGCKLCKEDK